MNEFRFRDYSAKDTFTIQGWKENEAGVWLKDFHPTVRGAVWQDDGKWQCKLAVGLARHTDGRDFYSVELGVSWDQGTGYPTLTLAMRRADEAFDILRRLLSVDAAEVAANEASR